MDAERLKQIEEIYHAALDLPEGDRESFFKQHCGPDKNLRREVESLLAFEKTFDDFIDSTPGSLAAEFISEQEKTTTLENQRIGHYHIKKLLGKGGMGEVYLANDTRLNRRVALKFLSSSISTDKTRLRRFEREAFAASALNHPNILTIYEFGSENETYFLAAEYVEGETLRDLLASDELPLKRILDISEQTAFALAAAHKAGIIHRDIKPENIMVREDGIVKVLDFGLAKLTVEPAGAASSDSGFEAETRVLVKTNPGIVMGTAAYMSPEQTRGLANVDARTDIWSLGVVIFEMIARQAPFAGDTISDVIASILKNEAPPLSELIENCPPELERIVAQTLQKDRETRYQLVKDLAIDLQNLKKELEFSKEFGRGHTVAEKNLTTQISNRKTNVIESGKRFSMIQVLFAILLTTGLIFGGGWWFFGRNFGRSEMPPETTTLKSVEVVSWTSSPGEFYSVGSFSPDGKMVAFDSTKTGAKNIWIKQTTSGEPVQITRDEFKNEKPIWSPSGEELAFFSARGNQTGFWRIPYLGGSPKLISTVDDGSSLLRFWSKKGLIYYESENDLWTIDVNTGEKKQATDFGAKNVKAVSISISPDEQHVAYTTHDDDMWSVWTKNLNGANPQKLFSSTSEIINTAWHPDNQRILYSVLVDGTYQIFVTDLSGTPPKQITFSDKDSFVLDVAADGTKILFGSAKEESDVWGVNLKDTKEFTIASEINSELWAAPAPDAKSIVYQSIKNLSQGNNLLNGKILTKKLTDDQRLTEIAPDGYLPGWSPNGQRIAYLRVVGNKNRLVTINSGGEGKEQLAADDIVSISYAILPYNRIQTSNYSWSPDSTKLAYISNRSGQNNIWIVNADGTNDQKLTDNTDPKLYLYCPLWAADGKRLAYTSKTGSFGKPTHTAWLIDTETKISKLLTQQRTFSRLLSWTQNDRELLLVSTAASETDGLPSDVTVSEVDAETGKMRETFMLKDTYLTNIQLSPDRKSLAFAAHREGKDNLWQMPVTGGEAKRLTDNNDSRLYYSSLAWSPDNNSIFFGKQSRYSLLSMLSNFK